MTLTQPDLNKQEKIRDSLTMRVELGKEMDDEVPGC